MHIELDSIVIIKVHKIMVAFRNLIFFNILPKEWFQWQRKEDAIYFRRSGSNICMCKVYVRHLPKI